MKVEGQRKMPHSPAHFSMRETRIITTNNVCLTAVSLPHMDNKVSFIAPSYQLTDT